MLHSRTTSCTPSPGLLTAQSYRHLFSLRARNYVFRAAVSLPLSHETLILQESVRLYRDGLKGGRQRGDFFSTQLCLTCTFSQSGQDKGNKEQFQPHPCSFPSATTHLLFPHSLALCRAPVLLLHQNNNNTEGTHCYNCCDLLPSGLRGNAAGIATWHRALQ